MADPTWPVSNGLEHAGLLFSAVASYIKVIKNKTTQKEEKEKDGISNNSSSS